MSQKSNILIHFRANVTKFHCNNSCWKKEDSPHLSPLHKNQDLARKQECLHTHLAMWRKAYFHPSPPYNKTAKSTDLLGQQGFSCSEYKVVTRTCRLPSATLFGSSK